MAGLLSQETLTHCNYPPKECAKWNLLQEQQLHSFHWKGMTALEDNSLNSMNTEKKCLNAWICLRFWYLNFFFFNVYVDSLMLLKIAFECSQCQKLSKMIRSLIVSCGWGCDWVSCPSFVTQFFHGQGLYRTSGRSDEKKKIMLIVSKKYINVGQ